MSIEEIEAIKEQLAAVQKNMFNYAKMFMWVIGMLVTINVSALLWTGSTLITHEYRMTKIESNRFTDKDAVILKDSILSTLPPNWLVKAVERNSLSIDELKDRSHDSQP